MGIKSLIKSGLLEVWPDLFDARVDDRAAPDLADVVGGGRESFYSSPDEFFERTYLTTSMRGLIEDVAKVLRDRTGGGTFILTSLFGGGKTHTQIFLYHAFTSPGKLSVFDSELASKVAEAGKPIIVVMDCSRANFVPHPEEPCRIGGFEIKTIWGMLAYRLGAYAKIKHLDSGKAAAPDVNLLRRILSEPKEPVIILLDEIVHYVFNMGRSERLKDYAGKVLLFLDYLSRAVEATPGVVLVASVQAEYRVERGQRYLFGERVFEEEARKVFRALSRESTRIVTPVAPRDVVAVLKKRLFKRIDFDVARKARDMLYSGYRENVEFFGAETDWHYAPTEAGRVITARETYPFHPKYVEVLQEFVTRNPDLQKTRDAIRITRKVLRRLLRGKGDPTFVMPWHIDLRSREVRRMVLTSGFSDFNDAVERDIVSEEGRLGSVRECSNVMLALRIATAVFLKTYTYETFKEPLKVFPDLKNVCLMAYDPETFAHEGLQPSDIATTLEEMVRRLPHFVSEEGRYWFTPFASVLEHVEKKAAELMMGPRLALYQTLKENVEKVLVSKRRGVEEKGFIFNKKNTFVVGFGEDPWSKAEIEDSQSLKLVVMVKPDVEEDEVRRLIFMSSELSRRIYRNTVAVVLPKAGVDFDVLLAYTARINAATDIQSRLGEYYRDRDIRSLQQGKLKKYIQDCTEKLQAEILSAFTKIAYPAKEGAEDVVKYVETAASNSIISQVEAGLGDPSTGPKIRTEFTFEDLREFIKANLNIDVVEADDVTKTFSEIVSLFYTSPSAPFTTRSAIEDALLMGVDSHDVGIWQDNEIYWKSVEPESFEVKRPLKDTAEIYSYRRAARIFADRLKGQSGEFREDKTVKIVWFEVETLGKKFRLEDLLSQEGWEDILKEGTIRRCERTIERGFLLKVEPGFLKVKLGEEAKIRLNVERVGDYSSKVTLKVERGTLTTPSGVPTFTSEWSLGALPIGAHSFTIEAVGEDGVEASEKVNVNVESEEWTEIVTDNLSTLNVGSKLVSVSPSDLLTCRLTLEAVSKAGLKAKANLTVTLGEKSSFTMRGEEASVAELYMRHISNIERALQRLKISVDGDVSFDEPPLIDSQKLTVFSPLNKRVRFKLWVKR